VNVDELIIYLTKLKTIGYGEYKVFDGGNGQLITEEDINIYHTLKEVLL